MTEIAVLISLFAAGLKLGLPLSDKPLASADPFGLRVHGSYRDAYGCGRHARARPQPGRWRSCWSDPLAPTDPVLASDRPGGEAGDRDRLRFGLTGKAVSTMVPLSPL